MSDYRAFTKLSPPLRAEEDRLAVIEELRNSTIDAIAWITHRRTRMPSGCRSRTPPWRKWAWRRC